MIKREKVDLKQIWGLKLKSEKNIESNFKAEVNVKDLIKKEFR